MRATSSRVLGAVLTMSAFVVGQQMIWVPVATSGPGARTDHAISYDSQRARIVLFGGGQSSGFMLTNETWEWDGFTWSQRLPTTSPYARGRHAMAYDVARGKTVMFGGSPPLGFVPPDPATWEWDGVDWTPVATSGPSPRWGHAMVYDSARGKVVLFGGDTLGETWEWDGTTWTNVAVSGPPPRSGHGMAYDSSRARVVLFGGYNNGAVLGDTWEWNGATWTPRGGGPARTDHVMAFDSVRGRTVLFGGGVTWLVPLNDTWEWDGLTWVQTATTGPSAVGLLFRPVAMAFDSGANRTVLFGGSSGTALQGGTSVWIDPPSGTASTFGTGCGNPSLQLSPDTGNVPTIGKTTTAFLTYVPSAFAFVAAGWSNTHAGPFQLPVPLDGYGMTGCYLLQSTEVIGLPATATGPGTAAYGLPLPFSANLIGLHIYLQGWAIAPGVNPAGIILSNGLHWTVGY